MFTILYLDDTVFKPAGKRTLPVQAHKSIVDSGLSTAIFPKPPVRFVKVKDKDEYIALNPGEVAVAAVVTWYLRDHINHMLRLSGLNFEISDRRVITPDVFKHTPHEKLRAVSVIENMIRMALHVRLDTGGASNVTMITDSDSGAYAAERVGIGTILRYATTPTINNFHGFMLK